MTMSLPRLLRSYPIASISSSLRTETPSLSRCIPWLQQRLYSIKTDEATLETLPDIDPSKLHVTETITPKELVPAQELVFGRHFTGTWPN